ncbi:hypothetical protein GRX03_11955 [Halovenus sp. WSH3]|uniref:Uncharacterized protein n=1 Tax=Halovenus carboxidivorans TaxID=2692199 RepID=A0A6B0T9R6_9EURY|nr:hypothetical protein [Halovenus carboxidivorans]MXR52313.1 hypothetical protein [Halovenus carboxidivorans]
MTQFELDLETFVIFPLFALGTASTLGLVAADWLPVISLGDVFVEVSGIQWTIGRLLSVGALGAVILNRDDPLDFDAWGVLEVWVLYVTVGLIIAPPFFPVFEGWITETPAAFVSFTIQSIGFALITYVN